MLQVKGHLLRYAVSHPTLFELSGEDDYKPYMPVLIVLKINVRDVTTSTVFENMLTTN